MVQGLIKMTKPGIIYGNAITAIGGFFLASRGHFNMILFISMIFGLSLVIASGCVVNNYIDRDIDKLMNRTKKRMAIHGVISKQIVFIYATAFLLLGLIILILGTNYLSALVAFVGFVFYAGVYSLWAKRRTYHAALIGGIAGAMPPLVGYVSVTNHLDLAALLLFIILCAWQMPHFFALALRHTKEYKAAGIPVYPLERGEYKTKVQMLLYTNIYAIATTLLYYYGYVGYVYLFGMTIFNLVWITTCFQGFTAIDTNKWAKKIFRLSLIGIILFSLLLSI